MFSFRIGRSSKPKKKKFTLKFNFKLELPEEIAATEGEIGFEDAEMTFEAHTEEEAKQMLLNHIKRSLPFVSGQPYFIE